MIRFLDTKGIKRMLLVYFTLPCSCFAHLCPSCIEEILSEELENVRSRLADINSLEFSVKTAEKRLDVIRCCLRESQVIFT